MTTSRRRPGIEDDDSIDPFWTITGMIPADLQDVGIGIQVWDHDSTSGDDLADSSPNDNDNNLDFVVHRATGAYSGDLTSPKSCADGDGGGDDEPPVRLCVDLGGDADGDGLLDTWEQNGYDDNGDGVVDVDLPGMGADPAHKDLFLEIDYDANVVPDRAGIQAMRDAFAAAPLDVGSRAGEREAAGTSGNNDDTFGVSMPPNPDGTRGITVHVDTGALVDPAAREGQVAGTCRDGVENGTDAKVDGADWTASSSTPVSRTRSQATAPTAPTTTATDWWTPPTPTAWSAIPSSPWPEGAKVKWSPVQAHAGSTRTSTP